MNSTYFDSSKDPRKKLQDRLTSNKQAPWSLDNTTSHPANGTVGNNFRCASVASAATLFWKSGTVAPVTRLPGQSGWSRMSGGGAHRTPPIKHLLRPSRYHCIFVVPLPIFPVLTSTSNSMESWSVAAPFRPALNTQEMASMLFSFDDSPSRDTVITRNVDRGAFSGS